MNGSRDRVNPQMRLTIFGQLCDRVCDRGDGGHAHVGGYHGGASDRHHVRANRRRWICHGRGGLR